MQDAAIKGFTWHCLRHTFASRLVMAAVDIRTIGELLGHKTLAMTMRIWRLRTMQPLLTGLCRTLRRKLAPQLTPVLWFPRKLLSRRSSVGRATDS
ncbi:MAG: tyrosine-type recombinase/integrase [Acidobacteriaceae bacterium]